VKLIDIFYQPAVLDCYTFVFDEHDSRTGAYTMLGMSEDGYAFSQWTSGVYEPGAANEHLGSRVVLSAVGAAALDGFFHRLSIPEEWEGIHTTVEQIVQERDE
jgi:hypothetical protein